ncbi:D-glucuronyl C5-epimerase family protein [Methanosarcina spelaei]|uniref:D-glucuronyl C5-epimerase family protein n=1 Tax=Methanosarcina spelaei TaxID=1036679 RepID=UPI000BAB4741
MPINNESASWYSSMAQGQAASALLWGYRISNDTRYLETIRNGYLMEKCDTTTKMFDLVLE